MYRSPREESILASAEFSSGSVMPFAASYRAVSRFDGVEKQVTEKTLCHFDASLVLCHAIQGSR